MAPRDKEPFDWEKITITLVIQYLPSDGDPAGRQVMIGARNSKDSPSVHLLRESEIGELPTCIQELLAELRTSLPNRQRVNFRRVTSMRYWRRVFASSTLIPML